MELWLLGAGAIVLVAITLWIVWPAHTVHDVVGTTAQSEEVSRTMTENSGSALAAQDDRYGNQYTSAATDRSAGSVASAIESMPDAPAANLSPEVSSHRWPPPSSGQEPIIRTETRSLAEPRTIGLGAAALLSIGGAASGAWLYARWRRQRNKPINRLRRGARDIASRLGERMPDAEDLPHGAAPISGATTALLLSGLLASRALRRDAGDRTDDVQASGVLHEALSRRREALDRGRDLGERAGKASKRLSSRLPMDRLPARVEPRQPAVMGIGLGGLALLAGGIYVIRRMLRAGSAPATSG